MFFVCLSSLFISSFFFFFTDTSPTEIYTLSLHDALPIYGDGNGFQPQVEEKLSLGLAKVVGDPPQMRGINLRSASDRKSTRLNSSHGYISYAVFCLKKKKKKTK